MWPRWRAGREGKRVAGCGLQFFAVDDGAHRVRGLAGEISRVVDEPGAVGERLGVQLRRRGRAAATAAASKSATAARSRQIGRQAVNVERRVRGFVPKQPPADEHLAVGLVNRDDAAIQFLHLPLSLRGCADHERENDEKRETKKVHTTLRSQTQHRRFGNAPFAAPCRRPSQSVI